MTGERILPGLGLTAYWDAGSDGYGAAVSDNFRLLSVLADQAVISRTTVLPGSGSAGDVYIVRSDDGTNPNKIAVWDGPSGSEAWVYLTPREGWVFRVKDEAQDVQWDGTAWADYAVPGAGGGASVTYLDRVLIDGAVIDATLTTPPGSPADADAYVVAAGATGSWSTHDGELAIYEASAWAFYAPAEGFLVRDQTNDVTYQYDGGAWTEFSGAGGGGGGGTVGVTAVEIIGHVSPAGTAAYYDFDVSDFAWATVVVSDVTSTSGTDNSMQIEIRNAGGTPLSVREAYMRTSVGNGVSDTTQMQVVNDLPEKGYVTLHGLPDSQYVSGIAMCEEAGNNHLLRRWVSETTTAVATIRVLSDGNGNLTGGAIQVVGQRKVLAGAAQSPTKEIATTTHTLTAADRGYWLKMTHASGCVVTIDASVFVSSDEVFIERQGGAVTFAAASGTTVNSPGGLVALANLWSTGMVKVHSGTTVTLAGDLA